MIDHQARHIYLPSALHASVRSEVSIPVHRQMQISQPPIVDVRMTFAKIFMSMFLIGWDDGDLALVNAGNLHLHEAHHEAIAS